jgi:hypothetical protein
MVFDAGFRRLVVSVFSPRFWIQAGQFSKRSGFGSSRTMTRNGFVSSSRTSRTHLLLLEDEFGRHDLHLLLQLLDPASSSQRLHINVIAS